MQNYLLIFLSLLIFFSALLTILSKNPIHSVLFLILTFIELTIVLITLNVEFIAMLFLVVYVGAIMVLFLFVVMMLNVKIVELDEKFIRYLPVGAFIGFIFGIEIILLLIDNFLPIDKILFQNIEIVSSFSNLLLTFFEVNNNYNIEQIAAILFFKYPYMFILAGMILLIAMVGAITLTMLQQSKHRHMNYHSQVTQTATKSIRFINRLWT